MTGKLQSNAGHSAPSQRSMPASLLTGGIVARQPIAVLAIQDLAELVTTGGFSPSRSVAPLPETRRRPHAGDHRRR